MTTPEYLPRIRAILVPPAAPDPTVVRPEVWEGLFIETVERLDVRAIEIFGARTAKEILEMWLRDGLTSERAREHARVLRETAFQQEGYGGAAPVLIANAAEGQSPPEVFTTLAAVFDYLAALAPRDSRIRFEDEAAE